MTRLLVISGADRVGKSTLIEKLKKDVDVESFHFSAPKTHPTRDFEEAICNSTKESIIFDRGWPDRFIFEQIRNNNKTGLWDYIRDFEIDLYKSGIEVFLLGITRPWNFSAALHLQEFPSNLSQFQISTNLEKARKEHYQVQELMKEYFSHYTMFQNHIIHDPFIKDIASYVERIGNWL